jgi:GNAT superfamily N-acetyltransferase
LQNAYYREHYQDAEFLIILKGRQPIGRLYIDRMADEHRLMDIALLPAYRGQGIGGALIGAVLAEAATAGKPVRLHVEKFNRVRAFYVRLGFTLVEDRGVYDFMEWWPPDGGQLNTAS